MILITHSTHMQKNYASSVHFNNFLLSPLFLWLIGVFFAIRSPLNFKLSDLIWKHRAHRYAVRMSIISSWNFYRCAFIQEATKCMRRWAICERLGGRKMRVFNALPAPDLRSGCEPQLLEAKSNKRQWRETDISDNFKYIAIKTAYRMQRAPLARALAPH